MATKRITKKERELREQNKREVTGVCLIAAALFFAVSVYSDAVGILGTTICKLFFGLFGVLGYALPVALFAAGVLIIVFSARGDQHTTAILVSLGVWCLISVIHVYYRVAIEQTGFIDYIKDAYWLGVDSHLGGGSAGAVLAYPCILLLGEVGAYILLITFCIVVILLVTKISIRQAGQKVGHSIKAGVESVVEKIETSKPLYTEDLLAEEPPLMPVQPEAAHRPAMQQDIDLLPHNSRLAHKTGSQHAPSTPIKDLGKVKYASGDLEMIPTKGPISRKKPAFDDFEYDSALDEYIDDALYSISEQDGGAPAEPMLFPEGRISRISNFAPEGAPAPVKIKEATPAPEKPKSILPQAEAPSSDKPENIDTGDATAAEYRFPPITLLQTPEVNNFGAESPYEKGKLLIETLASFNISAKIINISVGPAITRFELQPAQGIRVNRITTLSNDIALALAAPRVRIEAPIPGKAAVGIEIPNTNIAGVCLREIIESPEFQKSKSPVTLALGKDIAGKIAVTDLSKMPHLLIAGATGSGKSVCINDIVISLIYKASPQDVRMILVDPKVVELKVFSALPHLLLPVVTDPKKAAGALKWAVMEMDQRYQKMSKFNARDLSRYNALQTDPKEHMPIIVIIIDELADLMMVAAKEVEESICRIAQLGRAAGIHLIVATQRPSTDVITGLIKANIPSRIAFMVSSLVDSRVILDSGGAEKLLGKGDMLFHANGANKPIRAQGAFASDEEVESVMSFFEGAEQPDGNQIQESDFGELFVSTAGAAMGNGKQEDDLLCEAVKIVLESGQASISMIQRRLRVGYARAARLIDIMEQKKIVSGFDGSKPRKLLIGPAEYEAMFGQSCDEDGLEE